MYYYIVFSRKKSSISQSMKNFYMYLNVSSLGSLGLANVAMKMLGLSDANSQSVTDNVALPL